MLSLAGNAWIAHQACQPAIVARRGAENATAERYLRPARTHIKGTLAASTIAFVRIRKAAPARTPASSARFTGTSSSVSISSINAKSIVVNGNSVIDDTAKTMVIGAAAIRKVNPYAGSGLNRHLRK